MMGQALDTVKKTWMAMGMVAINRKAELQAGIEAKGEAVNSRLKLFRLGTRIPLATTA